MTLKKEGSFSKMKKSDTGRIYVPAALVKDSQFPLIEGRVLIEIKENSLVISALNHE